MNIILLIILAAFISSNLILLEQKILLPNMGNREFYCVKIIVLFIIVVLYILSNRKIYRNIKKINYKKNKLLILLDSLLTIINVGIWYYLLNNNEAHSVVGSINPLTISLVVILSYVFYDANITRTEMIGILFVLVGLIFINKK